MSDFSSFTAKQSAAIAALLVGSNLEEAAKFCHVATATLRRWRKEALFSSRYAEARGELLEFPVNRLGKISMAAVDGLHRVLTNEGTPPAVLVGAARTVLELQFRAKEILEITERLNKLEQSFASAE